MSKKYNDLTVEQKRYLLDMFRDAVHANVRKLLTSQMYNAFVHSLHGGPRFDPQKMWDSFPSAARNHFDHALEALSRVGELELELNIDLLEPENELELEQEGWTKCQDQDSR